MSRIFLEQIATERVTIDPSLSLNDLIEKGVYTHFAADLTHFSVPVPPEDQRIREISFGVFKPLGRVAFTDVADSLIRLGIQPATHLETLNFINQTAIYPDENRALHAPGTVWTSPRGKLKVSRREATLPPVRNKYKKGILVVKRDPHTRGSTLSGLTYRASIRWVNSGNPHAGIPDFEETDLFLGRLS